MPAMSYTDPQFALVLQPGLTSVSGAFAPVAFTSPLLMTPTPHGPMLDGLNRRRPLPHQMPEQAAHFRHRERQQLHADAPDGLLSPRWRAGARS
jgi:hypothetical protein